jgi:Transposase IS66 family
MDRTYRPWWCIWSSSSWYPTAAYARCWPDLFGAHLSLGTLVQWVQQAAATLEPVEAAIKAALARAPVLHNVNDETGMRQAGRVAWAHVASTARLTHYPIHPRRGQDATDAIGILPGYTGVSVHDGWKPYWANTQCRHALCNIHHLRELTFLEEEYAQAWAKELKGLLREMKAATDQARAQGARPTCSKASGTSSSPVTNGSWRLGSLPIRRPHPAHAVPTSAAGSSSPRRVTSSSASCSARRRCWPSSTT